MRLTFLLALFSTLLFSQDLGVLEIEGNTSEVEQHSAFESVFEEPEYEESIEHVQGLPSQKRMTKDEAMFIPGIQGDPIKAIQSLSGVTTLGNGSGELFIYGSKPEETLTTINHLPIGYLFHAGGLHSVIAPEAVGQIDAYLAGFDATYGNAMGGVINITPNYPDDELSGYGHVGIYDSSAGINVGVSDDVSFYLGARRSYFEVTLPLLGIETGKAIDGTKTTILEYPNYYDLTFMGKYQPDSNNLFSIELVSAEDKVELETYDNEETDPLAVGNVKSKSSFTTVGLRHQSFYANYESNTLLYYLDVSNRTELFAGYLVDFETKETGLYHQSTYSLDEHKLIAGVELQHFVSPLDLNITQPASRDKPHQKITDSPVYAYKNTLQINSGTLFIEDVYTPTENLLFRLGARFSYSDYESFGGYIDPRFSALYNIDDVNELSFSTGIYSQVPEGSKIIDQFGNPKSSSYERAAHYILHYGNSFFENTTIGIDPFYKDYFNLLIEDDALKYANGGEGYAYGVDMNFKMRLNEYYLYGAYTYLRSERQLNTKNNSLNTFYGEVPHTLQLIGGMKFWDNWALSSRMQYHSGLPYTEVVSATLGSDGRWVADLGEISGKRLPDFFSLDIKIAQQIKFANKQELEWSFELMNITNHTNVTGINYDDKYKIKGYSTALPLLPWFDVTYRF